MSSVLEIAALMFCVGNSSISVVEEAYETKSKNMFATRWHRVVSNYQSEIWHEITTPMKSDESCNLNGIFDAMNNWNEIYSQCHKWKTKFCAGRSNWGKICGRICNRNK